MAQGRKVNTDLVCAPRFKVHFHQRRLPERLKNFVVGHRGAPVLDDGEAPVVAGVAANGRVYGALQRVGQSLHHGVVYLLHRPFAESLLQHGVGVLSLGHHHGTGSAHIQAVHNADPLLGAGR